MARAVTLRDIVALTPSARQALALGAWQCCTDTVSVQHEGRALGRRTCGRSAGHNGPHYDGHMAWR